MINRGIILAGLGIVLVVLGHSDPTRPSDVAQLSAVKPSYAVFRSLLEWIYTFHMPLFFFLSGINYCSFTAPKNASFLSFLGSKAKRLLAPYLVFTTLSFPVKALLSRFALRPETFSFSKYLDGLFVPWHNPVVFFWFLPTLFLIFCVAPLLERTFQSRFLVAATAVLTIVLFWIFPAKDESWLRWLNLTGALHSVIFFYMGMIFQRQKLVEKVSSFWMLGGAASVVLYSFLKPVPPIAMLLFAILGILASTAFTRIGQKQLTALHWLGGFSFQIYLFSWFPQVAARVGFGQVLHLNLWLVVASMFLFGLLLPVLVAKVLDAYLPRSLQFLYGR